MYQAIIFDLGNVLTRFAIEDFMQQSGYTPAYAQQLRQAINHSGLWPELDRGLVPDEEIIATVIRDAGPLAKDVERTIFNVGSYLSLCPYALPWLKSLREQGYQLYYLSNYSRFLRSLKPEVLEVTRYMDGGLYSCDVRSIKPEPEIYRLLCSKYHLAPQACVFIDDREENVRTALRLGFTGLLFRGYPRAAEELAAVLAGKE